MFEVKPIADWIQAFGSMDWLLNLSFSGSGEPIMLKEFYQFISELEKLSNVNKIIIFTNTATTKQVAPYLKLSEKVNFNTSFHPTEISFEQFIENITPIIESKKLNVVNYVPYKFPVMERIARKMYCIAHKKNIDFKYKENRFEPDKLLAYKKKVEEIGGRFRVQGMGSFFGNPFTEKEMLFLKQFRLEEEAPFLFGYPETPVTKGVLCNSGRNYIVMSSNGNMRRCSASSKPEEAVNYDSSVSSNRYLTEGLVGNLFSGYKLYDKPQPCPYKHCTVCADDYTSLTINSLTHKQTMGFD